MIIINHAIYRGNPKNVLVGIIEYGKVIYSLKSLNVFGWLVYRNDEEWFVPGMH